MSTNIWIFEFYCTKNSLDHVAECDWKFQNSENYGWLATQFHLYTQLQKLKKLRSFPFLCDFLQYPPIN